jgi:hemolysin activation/secretion protein
MYNIKIFKLRFLYIILVIYIFTILLVTFHSALAQQAPQTQVERATVQSDRPVRERAEKYIRKTTPKEKPVIEEEKEKEEKEGPTFNVTKINLLGAESVPQDELKPIVEKYEGRDVTFEELSILAKKIERAYLKKGIVAACFVPPQEVESGIVTLQVVESKMGELKVKQDPRFFNKNRIKYYWQLTKGDVLRYDKISRSLQHINMNPDREAKATLHAGKEPGTTDVLLNVKTHLPFHTTFMFDKEGSTYTGLAKTGFGGRHNNFLGLDDTLLSGFMWGDHFYGVYAYHRVPITPFGTAIMYGFNYSKSMPKKDFDRFELKSMVDNYSFFLHQDLFQKDAYVGEAYTGIDFKNKLIKQADLTTNRDALRILRFGTNLIYRTLGTVTYIKPEFSQGLDFLGAKQKNFRASRGAENDFQKFKFGVTHRTPLPLGLSMNYNIKTQFVPKKVTPQEQFSLGGIDSVRGYPTGDYLADIAVQSNTELLYPMVFIPKEIKLPYAAKPLRDDVTGVVFFDYAYGQRKNSIAGEEQRVGLASIGTGFRIRLFNQALLRLEFGFPVSPYEPTSGSTKMRLHLSLTFEDKVHEEFERISKIIKQKTPR